MFRRIRFSVIINVTMMHEFNAFFWKRKIRKTIVVFGHIYVRKVHYTVIVTFVAPFIYTI